MRRIKRNLLIAAVVLMVSTASNAYSQFRATLGARYWLSTYYSDTGELDGVETGLGHEFAPLLRLQYKYVWAQFAIYWGWIPFTYEGHYEVFYNQDQDRLRHDYTGETRARRVDWNLALGLDISRRFGIFLMVREVKLRVKDDFDYTEYEFQYLTQQWDPIGSGNELVVWTNNKISYGGGLFWDFPLKAIPLTFQLNGSYLVVSRSGNLERFKDLISLYGGIRYAFSSRLAVQVGYRLDMFALDNIDEAHHGFIAGVLVPLY